MSWILLIAFDRWADSVILFAHGDGQWFGQDGFPSVVLGSPDTSATPSAPSMDVLSLGKFGFIILQFRDSVVVDGPGDDLVIFENVFITSADSSDTSAFVEPAYVFLSKDGRFFFMYPFDTSDANPYNWTGLAGIKPTNYGADTTNPDVWMGDRFDISAVGLDTVRFVLIADAMDLCPSSLCSGFDLDAAGCINCGYEQADYSIQFPVMASGMGADTSLYYSLSIIDGIYTSLGLEGIVIYNLNVFNHPGVDFVVRSNSPLRIYGGTGHFMNAFYTDTRPDTLGEIDSLLSRDIRSPFSVGDTLSLIAVRGAGYAGVDGVQVVDVSVEERWVPSSGDFVEVFDVAGRMIFRGRFGTFEGEGVFLVRSGSRRTVIMKRRR